MRETFNKEAMKRRMNNTTRKKAKKQKRKRGNEEGETGLKTCFYEVSNCVFFDNKRSFSLFLTNYSSCVDLSVILKEKASGLSFFKTNHSI